MYSQSYLNNNNNINYLNSIKYKNNEQNNQKNNKQYLSPIIDLKTNQYDKSNVRNKQKKNYNLITKTLAEDYPGLDYLGFHNVLSAKNSWYRILWFTIVTICLLIGLYTIIRIINEYANNQTATSISVKSVEKLLLPQLTVCATHAATINLIHLEKILFFNSNLSYTNDDIINFSYFMLAGSGFQKINLRKFDTTTMQRLLQFYDKFRGERSVRAFFHYFMNNFGLKCNEFLQDCRLGDQILDCCKIFVPQYLMRRGRCFRTIKLYQQSYDELGKLRISLRKPFEMNSNLSTNQEVLAFIAEHKTQIAPFPRYYLYPKMLTKARIMAKHISLMPAEEVCSDQSIAFSKDTCYLNQWLINTLEIPNNCTYPYMYEARNVSLKSCHPSIILSNYNKTVEASKYTMHSCILSCDRWEYTIAIERTMFDVIFKNEKSLPYLYRIDLSYNDLQYEEIHEVITVTFAGLIAQIGGQLSLFMGSSILNLTQVLIMIIILLRRSIFQCKKQKVSDLSNQEVNYCNKNYESSYDKNYYEQQFENSLFNKNDENLVSKISLSTSSEKCKKFKKTKHRVRPIKKFVNTSSQQSSTHAPSSLCTSVEHLSNQPAQSQHINNENIKTNNKQSIKVHSSSSSINEHDK